MTYVIAGGGTGGHVYPAIAVADAIKQTDPSAKIVFIGTERGLEDKAVPSAGYELERITVSGIKGRTLVSKVKALFQLPLAILHCMRLLRRHKARAVLGVGGYASGPAVIAAVLMRIPVGLCEPNSIPGFTNRVIGRFARRVFTAFNSTSTFFKPHSIRLVGNALRDRLTLAKTKSAISNPVRILIVGGSQGARALNERLPPSLGVLSQRGVALEIRHQTGKTDVQTTIASYEKIGLKADVTAFIDDMAEAYTWADIVICRSGATTCSEVLAVGPVAIFVPLPTAIYDHQLLNAKELEEKGACLLLPQADLSPEKLATMITELISDPQRVNSIINRARGLAKPNASVEIAHSFLNRFSLGIVVVCGIHFFTAV